MHKPETIDSDVALKPPVRKLAFWVLLAGAAGVTSQLLRLQQHEALPWLLLDYGGRLGCLVVLAINSAVRRLIYRREKRRIGWVGIVGYLLLFAVFQVAAARFRWVFADEALALGHYPLPSGALHLFDMSFGIALVAIQEELYFRRAMRKALSGLGDGRVMIATSAAIFALYHWWTGWPNVLANFVFGLIAMSFYRRSGAIWPVMLAHYLVDLAAFT
jgi:uncharacterized protein